jgi:tetrahydromethanopterin S-methyltransferase subunit D
MLEKITTFFLAISLIVALSILYAVPVVFLWNWCLVGTIDGFHEINFWKALGISILINMISAKSTTSQSK